ncbi:MULTISPECIES: N-acetyltransferase [unclassified Mycolicibacterium]|uniref:GNAT family N-acetyltransferase n=1 Tax=unclassified Mycolicibacterium TaxID=2636767 RepID=UPI0012DC1D7B|nr:MULTISPECIES: GNAT family N-acetyltransferase [unclassified Mycolicibacterium]MUL80231.1 GNAT family N-acetyltransferase [Mycolicibacterium sp. CBMA 329]MUL85998.1 GNAT family N-acetyltransferase [Mycolicibacterium sp. CBMA 331]MUM00772.1 GNAT family N-acetyltransferase [Mycolicibacterium sp. CBMA 334]MUM28196.1 GNAT family N-acetyltransferase [Mycolicibacterium sp. CBMA 295]MUM36294.1 GNAT family N-acetyltransferase [Mycolicibacterium sp. CBMA 247]
MHIDLATAGDLRELAAVAAATFPLACPPSVTDDNIAAFIAETLSEGRFGEYLTNPNRIVLVAHDTSITGYAMLIHGVPDDDDVQRAVPPRPALELSKIYVLPARHGGGAARALMAAALRAAAESGVRCVWLGVNQENQRAQRFYAKHGFTISGTKTFRLGTGVENDYVMVRPIGLSD